MSGAGFGVNPKYCSSPSEGGWCCRGVLKKETLSSLPTADRRVYPGITALICKRAKFDSSLQHFLNFKYSDTYPTLFQHRKLYRSSS